MSEQIPVEFEEEIVDSHSSSDEENHTSSSSSASFDEEQATSPVDLVESSTTEESLSVEPESLSSVEPNPESSEFLATSESLQSTSPDIEEIPSENENNEEVETKTAEKSDNEEAETEASPDIEEIPSENEDNEEVETKTTETSENEEVDNEEVETKVTEISEDVIETSTADLIENTDKTTESFDLAEIEKSEQEEEAKSSSSDSPAEELDPFDMITGEDVSRLPDVVNPNEKKEEPISEEPGDDIDDVDPFDMITGEDVSRLPEVVNPNAAKAAEPEKAVEPEKATYAQAARSRPTSECNPEEPVVEDVEDPVVENVEPVVNAAPKVEATPTAVPEAEGEGKQSRAERKTKKAMMKLGLSPVDGINRVVLRKDKSLLFVVPNPEVFRKGDTWVVLGEARVEDPNQRAREMAAQKMAQDVQQKKPETIPTTITEEEEEVDVPAEGVEEKDIELVMQQASCSRAKAISALKSNSNDIVNAIMELTI